MPADAVSVTLEPVIRPEPEIWPNELFWKSIANALLASIVTPPDEVTEPATVVLSADRTMMAPAPVATPPIPRTMLPPPLTESLTSVTAPPLELRTPMPVLMSTPVACRLTALLRAAFELAPVRVVVPTSPVPCARVSTTSPAVLLVKLRDGVAMSSGDAAVPMPLTALSVRVPVPFVLKSTPAKPPDAMVAALFNVRLPPAPALTVVKSTPSMKISAPTPVDVTVSNPPPALARVCIVGTSRLKPHG